MSAHPTPAPIARLCAFCASSTTDLPRTVCAQCGASLPGLPRRLVRGPNPAEAPAGPRGVPITFARSYLFGTAPFWLASGAIAAAIGVVLVGLAHVWPSAIVPMAWLVAYGGYLGTRVAELLAMRDGKAARGVVLFAAPSRQGWNNTQIRYVFLGPERLEGEIVTSDPAARLLRPGEPVAVVYMPGWRIPGVGIVSALWPPFRPARWP